MKDIIIEKYGKSDPKLECLDHGFVTLVDCMPRVLRDEEETADYSIVEAARTSYQRGTKTIADDKTLIRYLMRHDHSSPLEMIEFKFHCKMPIFVARQWVRHRTASISELSGRYSEMPNEFYIPRLDDYRIQSQTNTQGSEKNEDVFDSVAMMGSFQGTSSGAFEIYLDFLEQGLAREQARIILPLNTYTEWFWKIDLKNILHFLDLRCDHHSQKEIQVYGNAILNLITPIVPWTISAWEDYSPYRGGMMLTRFEVEAIKRMIIDSQRDDGYLWYAGDIEVENKLERREWKAKAKILGFEV